MRFQAAYDQDPGPRERTTIIFAEPWHEATMTHQEFKEESDINNIIARYKARGYPNGPYVDPLHPGTTPPQFGDFSAVPDLIQVQNQLIEAENMFMELPSEIRRRFDNDPIKLLEFIQDESNREEAIKLGFINAPPITTPEPAPQPDSQNTSG